MKKNLIFLATSIFLLGFSFLFNSCGKVEKGCDCEESRFLRKTMLVSGSIIEDHVQTPLEADGACHATFDLKFRWADDDWAYNNPDRPPLSYEFQSLFAYFPTNLGMESSSVSSYDGGKYITTWHIKINEAVDKNNPEATALGVYVKHIGDGGFRDNHAIKCDVEISYKYYDEKAYIEDCDR